MRAIIIFSLLTLTCATSPGEDAGECIRWAKSQPFHGDTLPYLDRIDYYHECMRERGWAWRDARWVRSWTVEDD